jgi:hypothetical protein
VTAKINEQLSISPVILRGGCDVHIPSLVPSRRLVLAAGIAGPGDLSLDMVVATSLPPGGNRRGRSPAHDLGVGLLAWTDVDSCSVALSVPTLATTCCFRLGPN